MLQSRMEYYVIFFKRMKRIYVLVWRFDSDIVFAERKKHSRIRFVYTYMHTEVAGRFVRVYFVVPSLSLMLLLPQSQRGVRCLDFLASEFCQTESKSCFMSTALSPHTESLVLSKDDRSQMGRREK